MPTIIPFTFGVATSGDNFTDRTEETQRLVANFTHGVNTILISPRRWGKTSLVRKAMSLAQSNELRIVYLDIFSCRSEQDFYNAFATAVIRQTSSKTEELIENAKTFLSRFKPSFSIGDEIGNELRFSIGVTPEKQDIEDILQLPERISEKKGCRILVCIDEFQQIGEFKDSITFQKRLRSFWQLQKNVSYCLFGSRKHMMSELFDRKSRPFYKFGDIINLERISTEDWTSYIQSRFEITGKSISVDFCERICNLVENYSSYFQQFAWLVWVRTENDVTEEAFTAAFQDLINQNSSLFEKMTDSLSVYQMNFLRAVSDNVQTGFSRTEIIEKYNLSTSSNIAVIKRALIKKELIDVSGKNVIIPDPLLRTWLKQNLF